MVIFNHDCSKHNFQSKCSSFPFYTRVTNYPQKVILVRYGWKVFLLLKLIPLFNSPPPPSHKIDVLSISEANTVRTVESVLMFWPAT